MPQHDKLDDIAKFVEVSPPFLHDLQIGLVKQVVPREGALVKRGKARELLALHVRQQKREVDRDASILPHVCMLQSSWADSGKIHSMEDGSVEHILLEAVS